jgi:hypothetical protein
MKDTHNIGCHMLEVSPVLIFGFTLAIVFVGVYLLHAMSR